ncbi:hypothetical protein ACZ75_06700 [Massilia sp. NR 4-1]|nr:hypothetical protein ACZ75_06700 [Massilia sp. NR 4-1]
MLDAFQAGGSFRGGASWRQPGIDDGQMQSSFHRVVDVARRVAAGGQGRAISLSCDGKQFAGSKASVGIDLFAHPPRDGGTAGHCVGRCCRWASVGSKRRLAIWCSKPLGQQLLAMLLVRLPDSRYIIEGFQQDLHRGSFFRNGRIFIEHAQQLRPLALVCLAVQ